MEETSSLYESVSLASTDPNHGWQKVTYAKRHRKQPVVDPVTSDNHASNSNSNVFAPVEQKARERRRAIESAAAAAGVPEVAAIAGVGSDEEEDDEGAPRVQENGGEKVKKPKQKKPKNPKVTIAEAAAGIDSGDLAAYLADISGSYEDRQDIQLMRFADYFGRVFATVSVSQFPWVKIFKESPVSKIIDIPVCHISEAVNKTAADWLAQKSQEALCDFAIWSLDNILADLAAQQASTKASKKPVQPAPVRSQVAMFVVLAITLRRKPDTLISLLPKLRENSKYQGSEKLPIIIWLIGQASMGDLVVGTYLWARYLFPTVCGKSGNPQSRDLVLQLIERILSVPKARSILVNGAVRKGERVVPPSSLDLLMRATFPLPSARIKATERFDAVYPVLKELALSGSPSTKTTKQASNQLLPYSVKAMQENNPELTREGSEIFIWCLTQNTDCYKQWEDLHLGNLEVSVVVLRKIATEWKDLSLKLSSDSLRETLKHLKAKTEEAIAESKDSSKQALLKEADKYCKGILGKLTSRFSCVKGSIVIFVVLSVAAGVALSPNMDSADWNKIHAMFTSHLSF